MVKFLYVIKIPDEKERCDPKMEKKFKLEYDLVANPVPSKDVIIRNYKIFYGNNAIVESYELPKNCLESQVFSVKLEEGKTKQEKDRLKRMLEATEGQGLDIIAP